ncbi:DUF1194 domain-containing protein [Pseudooceanicola algae]|uniref:VWFA domain-containing protein n=1 Tax=Pseudooceanicola algae TaxID=1537215 RepID=A0A418SGR0_9RHOB|nr:DUF1194 domain-containing protein [Pseudooceanicola algae]QPM88897.1 hypothetical protein PSAL_001000 [Pseudooceanicola algae]
MLRIALLLATLAASVAPASAESCRKALALGLDVSGSVDADEYRLQLDGLAAALGESEVRRALLDIPGAPARLMVFEWSGPADQRVLAPWRSIRSPGDIAALQDQLRHTQRQAMEPSTALGAAMNFARRELDAQDDCWSLVLDVSGDGVHNTRPHPASVDMGRITVNALAIGSGDGTGRGGESMGIQKLSAYFRAYVLRGPDAFVETALGFEGYHAAMARKLLRELQVLAVSQVTEP